MKKYYAESIGTLFLVLFGCGTVAIGGSDVGLTGISLAFGMTVTVMIYTVGGISGCHINPAVTLAMLMSGRIRLPDAMAYILSQLIGATAGAAILLLIQLGHPGFIIGEWALGANGWGPGYQDGYTTFVAFAAETVFTFFFLIVILAVTSKTGNEMMAGLVIGLALTVVHFAGIHITGVSVNPARSFGPAILAGGKALQQLWLFWLAPFAGALLAAWTWIFFSRRRANALVK